MPPPLKILFLHGYTQSGPLLRAKTRALEKLLLKALPPGSTLTFPTAPHRLKPRDLPGHPDPSSEEEGETDSWAWWRRNDATGEYTGLDATWAHLGRLLDDEGPFDGCMGFSQGGALTSMLASLLERPGPHPLAGRNHPPLRFAVVYSGFRAPPAYDGLYAPPPGIATPTLHFVGSLDTVVAEERSLALVAAHAAPGGRRVVYHPGGHYVPAGKQFVGVLVAFVREVCAPREEEEEGAVEDMEVPF